MRIFQHNHSATASWPSLNHCVVTVTRPLRRDLHQTTASWPLWRMAGKVEKARCIYADSPRIALPLDHCVMVVLEGVSTRARKPLPKVNHHVDALLVNRSAPYLTWMMPRHVELAARSNGPGRISMARATCTSSPHTARSGYIRMAREDESKREVLRERLSSPAHLARKGWTPQRVEAGDWLCPC